MPTKHPVKLAHVVYRTRRFEEMIDWYKTVFNARVRFENPGLAFLTFDDEHHRFAIANLNVFLPGGSGTDTKSSVGVDHVGYTHSSVSDLLENYAALKESGINPYWCVHHGLTASMYYADPDGNQMEFQVDSLPAGSDPGKYMADNFGNNPIGVEYDPEEWLARLRGGEDELNFLVRQFHEPISPIRGAFAEMLAEQV